ncbi:SWIM zinc finger family protein [Streptomyces microflavus]
MSRSVVKKADDGRTRTFPPLSPARGRRSFAESWWGNAWVEALEGKQRLATGRLARGRTYARGGNVGEITVTPGQVAARVQGSRPTPYRTSMDIPQLSPREWELLLDTAAAQAGHIAALLDRDMPTTLVDDAARAGVRLLPRQGELTPSCSCPDWGYPCKHAAAVFYQVARLLDEDPFVLLLLRGRGERELMDELQRRNAVRAAADDAAPQTPAPAGPLGVPARDVYAAARAGIAALPPRRPKLTTQGRWHRSRPRATPHPDWTPRPWSSWRPTRPPARHDCFARPPCPATSRTGPRPGQPHRGRGPRTPRGGRTPIGSLHPALQARRPHPTRSHERYGPGSRAAPQPCRSWTTRGTRTHRNSTWPARRSSRRGRANGPQDCEPRETG